MKVYIGWDPREQAAYNVACKSLLRHASSPVAVERLELERNEHWGLIKRPKEIRDGKLWDVISGAHMATEFGISRFLAPMLAQSGWALFVDCDVVFLRDVNEILEHADPTKAVMVVKHDYTPKGDTKMDGQVQSVYARKNWSSVCLWNVDHPANRRLSLSTINKQPGRDLHRFCWLQDDEIGELPPEWNWLVGEQPKPKRLAVAHFTNGGPFLNGWEPAEHDELWLAANED